MWKRLKCYTTSSLSLSHSCSPTHILTKKQNKHIPQSRRRTGLNATAKRSQCSARQSEYKGCHCQSVYISSVPSTTLMNYAHCINSLCGEHEAMDTVIYNSCVMITRRIMNMTMIFISQLLYRANPSIIGFIGVYVCVPIRVRNLLSLTVSADTETPHPLSNSP